MSNTLNKEKSVYLQQHANDPIHWKTWSDELLEKAKKEKRIIFVSIGYAACHWCHVMHRECFQDTEVANYLNENYVCIKVDREERPDLDSIYQSAHYILSEATGGWPLSSFINPYTQLPIFSGLYFPKEKFLELIQLIDKETKGRLENISESQVNLVNLLNSYQERQEEQLDLSEIAKLYCEQNDRIYDEQNGGYGSQTKFPQTAKLKLNFYLGRIYHENSEISENVLRKNKETIYSICSKGLNDCISGGFFRYCVDPKWQIPHFEKMLYDNALILDALCDAWVIGNDPLIKDKIFSAIKWLEKELKTEDGKYYSSIDADSNGIEGGYYTFSKDEIEKILTTDELNTFHLQCQSLQIENEDQYFPIERGKHLSEKDRMDLGSIFKKLDDYRWSNKFYPTKNTNIILSWNGMALKAISKAAKIFQEDRFSLLSENLIESILKDNISQLDKDNLCLTNNDKHIFIDDYAFLIDGLIEYLEYRWDDELYSLTLELTNTMIDLFWDHKEGFWFNYRDRDKLLFNPKIVFDESTPSGYAIAIIVLTKLGIIAANSQYLEIAERAIQIQSEVISKTPQSCSMLFLAANFYTHAKSIIFFGDQRDDQNWNKKIYNQFNPHLFAFNLPNNTSHKLFQDKLDNKNKNNIFVCGRGFCSNPFQDLEEVFKQI